MSSPSHPAGPLGATRWTSLWWGAGLLTAAVLLGVWIYFFRHNDPFAVDVWWHDLLSPDREGPLLSLSLALNWIGGGWFGVLCLPLLIAAALAIARRPWAMVMFLVASIVSALLVQGLKFVFGRARPEDILVLADPGSYPSGHVANAATIALALVVVFPRLWVALVGAVWVVMMAFSRTYLSAHWLSDTLGGALAGAAAVLLVVALLAPRLRAEATKRTDAPARARH